MVSEGLERTVLFRGNVALDRGGRGHGYGSAVGSTTGHAELRRVCAEGPDDQLCFQLLNRIHGHAHHDQERRSAVGSTTGHAELRRVCAEGPVARPAVMEKSRVAPDTRHPDKLDR